MSVHETIRNRRTQLNLTTSEVAGLAGLSAAAYEDIENYPNEIFELVPLGKIKRILSALKLDLLDVFLIACAFCSGQVSSSAIQQVPRHQMLKQARLRQGLSKSELARRIGFLQFEEEMETDPERLES